MARSLARRARRTVLLTATRNTGAHLWLHRRVDVGECIHGVQVRATPAASLQSTYIVTIKERGTNAPRARQCSSWVCQLDLNQIQPTPRTVHWPDGTITALCSVNGAKYAHYRWTTWTTCRHSWMVSQLCLCAQINGRETDANNANVELTELYRKLRSILREINKRDQATPVKHVTVPQLSVLLLGPPSAGKTRYCLLVVTSIALTRVTQFVVSLEDELLSRIHAVDWLQSWDSYVARHARGVHWCRGSRGCKSHSPLTVPPLISANAVSSRANTGTRLRTKSMPWPSSLTPLNSNTIHSVNQSRCWPVFSHKHASKCRPLFGPRSKTRAIAMLISSSCASWPRSNSPFCKSASTNEAGSYSQSLRAWALDSISVA